MLGRRISQWNDGKPRAFEFFLRESILRETVSGNRSEGDLPAFSTIRRLAENLRRKASSTDDESFEDRAAWAEEQTLRIMEEAEETAEIHENMLREAEQRFRDAESLNVSLREQIEQLRQSNRYLHEKLLENQVATEEFPDELSGIEDWCREQLAGSVIVHNKALRAVKNAEYEDLGLIYRALLLLRDHYVPLRRVGGKDIRERYEAALADLGLEETQTFTGHGAGEQGDTFYVKHNGRRRLLERHLKKGNSRDPRYCFRCYFFWDDDLQEVVIGSLPKHLRTRRS
jgi:hypothetical protein